MNTHAPPTAGTTPPKTLKTIPELLIFPSTGFGASHVLQSRADLDAAKGSVSLLTLEGMKELKAWLEGLIVRRDGF